MKIKFFTLLFTAALTANVYADNTGIIVNGESIALDNNVKIVENRSYVPLREIGEKILNAQVIWDASTKAAILKKDNNTITVPMGSDNIIVNGVEREIDYPAFSENGISYVPVRAIAEGFNYTVGYDHNTISISNNSLVQFSPVKKGEVMAEIQTNLGSIKLRFFPEYAPLAVDNFITHAENGYYNGLTFHRVINGFMIQSGDPTGTGAGGESIWKKPFENEVNVNLRNFRGALAMANAGANTNESQFYIVQNNKLDTAVKEEIERMMDADEGSETALAYPKEILKKYLEIGGAPYLDFGYTVFGQVVEGMEIVDKIAAVETNGEDKPFEDIVINRIYVYENQ